VEVGHGQADIVSGLAREAGLEIAHVRRDLPGIARVVVAQRPAA
jgi:hypothetical protein